MDNNNEPVSGKYDVENPTSRELHWLEKLNFAGQFCLVLVGITAACIYKSQLNTMNRQLQEMKGAGDQTDRLLRLYEEQLKALQTTTAQSVRSADAATSSRINAENFFRTDERAWVEIGKIEKVATYSPNPPFHTIFKYSLYPTNVGKTVARNIRVHVDDVTSNADFGGDKRNITKWQDQLLIDNRTKRRITGPDKPHPQTLAPTQTSPVAMYAGGQEPYFDGKRTTESFVLGRVDYRDAFDVQHWMRFCYVIGRQGQLGNCQNGNDEDTNPEPPAK